MQYNCLSLEEFSIKQKSTRLTWCFRGGRGTRTPKPYGGGFQDR